VLTDGGHNTFGLILAGGQGSRMGGLDKGLVPLHGRPMIAHVLERFAPQVSRLALNVNRYHLEYESFSLPLVSDTLSGFPGPLAGLAAGMEFFQNTCGAVLTDWIVTTPCDSPFLPTDLVETLRAEAQQRGAPIAVARTPSGAQPVFAVYQIGLLASLQSFLTSGKRKIDVWTAQHSAIHVDFADENAFTNINTLAELRLH
jgi:molybdenum cofactor guanylyltransferase